MLDFFRRSNKRSESGVELRIEFCSEEQWDGIVQLSMEHPVYIFKHSSRCGVSSMVRSRFEKQVSEENRNYFHLHIQACRNVSNWLSEKLQIRHESPQLLVIHKGKVLAHASHYDILDIVPNLKE